VAADVSVLEHLHSLDRALLAVVSLKRQIEHEERGSQNELGIELCLAIERMALDQLGGRVLVDKGEHTLLCLPNGEVYHSVD